MDNLGAENHMVIDACWPESGRVDPADDAAYDAAVQREIDAQARKEREAKAAHYKGIAAQLRVEQLEGVLRDLIFGADMMLQIPTGGALDRYASEVKRVAQQGLVKP